MAEILLSLTIIGVVAAITLPSLTGNINERTWNTQRKALYARMSQAIALMPAINGYGTAIEETNAEGAKVVTSDNTAETFVTAGLSKVFKINNICANDHLADCGIVSEYTTVNGAKKDMPTTLHGLNYFFNMSWHEVDGAGNPVGDLKTYHQIDTKAVAFETANGESILAFYNKQCRPENVVSEFLQDKVCANLIYDLNGKKGPNTMGKDMGVMTMLYSTDTVVVAPVVYNNTFTSTQLDASNKCKTIDDNARLPNLEEFSAIAVNSAVLGLPSGQYWTSKINPDRTDLGYVVHTHMGRIYSFFYRNREYSVMCVHRY